MDCGSAARDGFQGASVSWSLGPRPRAAIFESQQGHPQDLAISEHTLRVAILFEQSGETQQAGQDSTMTEKCNLHLGFYKLI